MQLKLRITKANRPFMTIELNDTWELQRVLGEFMNDQTYMDFISSEAADRVGSEAGDKAYQQAESDITEEMLNGFYFLGMLQKEPRSITSSYPQLKDSEDAKKLFFFITSVPSDYDCIVED